MKSLMLFLFLLTQVYGYSQTVNNSVSYDSFNIQRATLKYTGDQSPVLKNCFSINATMFFSGDYSLYYERKIAPYLGLQAGLGATQTNYFYNTFGDNIFGSNTTTTSNYNYSNTSTNSNSDSAVFNTGFNDRTASVGESFMIQPKLYFGKKDFQGLYIGLEYRFRRYNYTSNQYQSFYLNQTVTEHRSVTDMLLMFGGSHVLGNHVNIQYYLGFGPRSNAFYYAHASSNGSSFDISYRKLNESTMTIMTGLNIGYVF